MVAVNILPDTTKSAPPFQEGFEFYPRMVLIVGRGAEVIALNRLIRTRLNINYEGAIPQGLHIEDLFSGPRKRLMKDLFAAATGVRLCLRTKARNDDKSERVSFQVTPLREGTHVLRFLLTETLSHAIPRAFDSLSGKVREANKAAAEARLRHRQLQESYQSLEQFSYVAAHDLQAPLRNIATLIRFVEEDHGPDLPVDACDLLGSARSAADRLQCLITDLLEHAKSSATDLDPKQLCLSSAVAAALHNLSTQISATGAQIDVPPDLGEITADRMMVHQVLENLIGNALKYRHPDRRLQVRISRDRDEQGRDCLLIRDNGIGFDPALKNRLFTAFQRLHAGTEIPGTGIGLTTCRIICDRHGWHLDAEGVPGEGACFIMSGLS